MSEHLHEFEELHTIAFSDTAGRYDWAPGTPITVDLRWVMSAEPAEHDATVIMLAGSMQQITVRIPYRDFVSRWRAIDRSPETPALPDFQIHAIGEPEAI